MAHSAYIDTTFNPAVDGVNYTQNSAAALLYIANQRTTSNDYAHGGGSATSYYYLLPSYLSAVKGMINGATPGSKANTDGTNFIWTINRTGSTGFNIFKNKSDLGAVIKTSVAPANVSMTDLALQVPASTIAEYSADTVGLRIFSSGLSQTNIDNICDDWAAFKEEMPSSVLFYDNCDGSVIDTTKWLVTLPDASIATATQSDALTLNVWGGTSTYYTPNMISSKVSAIHGAFTFSILTYGEKPAIDIPIREIIRGDL